MLKKYRHNSGLGTLVNKNNKKSLFKWTVHMHNLVNKLNKKKEQNGFK